MAQFLWYDCTLKRQCTIPVILTFDLWRSIFVQWIEYIPISILYKLQIDISSNSWEIKYQNIGRTHTQTHTQTDRQTGWKQYLTTPSWGEVTIRYCYLTRLKQKLGGLACKQGGMWENVHEFPQTKRRRYPQYRSVDELTTFYILRWVNNVFHILLKIWHIIVWFGPNCLGKSTPSFRIYDMIKKICRNVFLTMRL